MDRVYYKNTNSSIKLPQREKRLILARDYKDSNTYVDTSTGEIKQGYPPIAYDNREAKAAAKERNLNSYAHRLKSVLGDDAYFYTLPLSDLYPSWGAYDAIFNPDTVGKVKKRLGRIVNGPYTAGLELSAYTGAHAHIISGRQVGTPLKAETLVYDYFGLVRYMSKSVINPKDRSINSEEYDVMVGTYLEWKGMMGKKYLPRRSWTRLKC
ncbi:hypothetical protein L1280_002467 [Deinococcus sp. HSC-46F16]|uniref:hypothetical protein n=1 Tax=Deinococcus sp. HSC-46F16 TaxID=2910968 RepID=UPI0020A061AB|nr:hypothetical protein [Deinococcus sp. HSC-46F16]MCP2015306.1 hypothetical protein [Deinococcus sp. HSC-46F16]